jgi:hypothetical protein
MRGYTKQRERETEKKRRPFYIAVGSLIAIAAGWLVWSGAAGAAFSSVGRWADAQRDPKTYGLHQAELPSIPEPAKIQTPIAASEIPKPVPAPEPPRPQVEQASAAVPALEPEKPPAGMRAWYGVVYDLVTLRPLAGAKLAFSAGNQEIAVAMTDAAGHYHVKLDMAHSLWLSVSIASAHQGYLRGLIEDRDPPILELPLETRRVIMDDTKMNDVGPVPLRIPAGARVIELNLVVVPSVGPAASALAPSPMSNRRVSGQVYDLASLAPVSSAMITFTKDDNEEDAVRAMTNKDGSYDVSLPKGDGWTVSVAATNRRPGQVFDIDPGYRTFGVDVRRAALESVTDGDLAPAPVEWPRGKSAIRLNLIVMPERWPSPPK